MTVTLSDSGCLIDCARSKFSFSVSSKTWWIVADVRLVCSPTGWGIWPLFAAVSVQWHQSWCSARLLQWRHQRSELPSPAPGPPAPQVQISAGCLHPAPPGDCQRGTSSECCRSLSPQVCKKTRNKDSLCQPILMCWMHRICCHVKVEQPPWAKNALLTFVKRRHQATKGA